MRTAVDDDFVINIVFDPCQNFMDPHQNFMDSCYPRHLHKILTHETHATTLPMPPKLFSRLVLRYS